MFSRDELKFNHDRFVSLIQSINRDGMEKDRLIVQLEKGDFFRAPASTIYHNCVEGGLCAHSLNVYDYLVKVVNMKYPIIKREKVNEAGLVQYDENHNPIIEEVSTNPYSEDSLKIVALLHDFSKMNYYESYMKNQKVYSPDGSKKEQTAEGQWVKFDWVSTSAYKVKDASERFIFGNHEQTSLYMTEQFVPLSVEESAAILWHHMGMSADCVKEGVGAIMSRYELALLLHIADTLAAYSAEELNH